MKKYLFLLLIVFSASVLYAQHTGGAGKGKGTVKNKKDNVKDTLKTLKIMNSVLKSVSEGRKDSEEEEESNIELDGLIIDETRTHIGRKFYNLYCRDLNPPKQVKNYTIRIKEKILQGGSTFEFTIMLNDFVIVKERIRPRYDMLVKLSRFANARTVGYLNALDQIRRQLENEGLSGSGIY